MKHITSSCLVLALSISMLSACSQSKSKDVPGPEPKSKLALVPEKVLIVYLSRTNNTRAVAQMIQAKTGGKMVALELVTPYPENYQTIVAQVADENARGFLPPLKTKIAAIKQYDVIFLGFPTWGMQLPPPVKSFLKENDLKGKTIIPFNTNAGYGVGSTFSTVKELSPGSTVLDGFTTRGGIERDGVMFVMEGKKETEVKELITKWLEKVMK